MTKRLPIFLLFLFLVSCTTHKIDNGRIERIGKSIISIDTSKTEAPILPDVVFIGNGLIEKVVALKRNAKSFDFKVKAGDLDKPWGIGKADCVLTIDTDYQDIEIRLKYNKQKDKYDILGWMTL